MHADPSRSLRALASAEPDRLAAVDGSRSVTFAQLNRAVDAMASRLEGLGARPGSRVVLALENSIRFVEVYVAVRRVGAVAVPVNPLAPPPIVEETVQDAAPQVVVTEAPATVAAERVDSPEVEVDAGAVDLAAIIYTSGTTGRPKGVMLTDANLAAVARAGCDLLDLGPTDRMGVVTPLFHLYGLREIDTALLAGAALVICGQLTYPALVLGQLHEHLVTGVSGVPSAFRIMVARCRQQLEACADHLRFVALGTDVAPPELLASLATALPRTRLLVTYGLTELSRACHRDVPSPDDWSGTVGRPYPGVGIEILDDAGHPAPTGAPGHVVLSSPMVSPGYWRRPDLTAATMLGTNRVLAPDIGRLDADGYLSLVGRVDDVVNAGGQKVGPDEVELVLRRHPGVEDAAVTGVPDPSGVLGQVVKAWVVPAGGAEPTVDELLAHCARQLDPYKVPRLIELCPELPKSVLGKTSRQLLGKEA
ncbi:MAG TPA: class I adenylate-forming enzyme family protein [Actinomycetota bacterium]|nr:class I adenylate-forming enzyme family protein [Actinomycetota bacterium]